MMMAKVGTSMSDRQYAPHPRLPSTPIQDIGDAPNPDNADDAVLGWPPGLLDPVDPDALFDRLSARPLASPRSSRSVSGQDRRPGASWSAPPVSLHSNWSRATLSGCGRTWSPPSRPQCSAERPSPAEETSWCERHGALASLCYSDGGHSDGGKSAISSPRPPFTRPLAPALTNTEITSLPRHSNEYS